MSRIIGVRDLHIAKITQDNLEGTTYEIGRAHV